MHIDTFWVPIFLEFIRKRCPLIVVTVAVLEIMFMSCFIVVSIVVEVDIVVVVAGLLS